MKPTPILVIASYPPAGEKHSSAIVGGAMYAKNTLQAVMEAGKLRHESPKITVLAEKFHSHAAHETNLYREDGIEVKRFWKRGNILAYFSLLKEIVLHHSNTKTVVIEFEFAMFGERLSLLPLPLFLIILRLMGKRVIFVFHQVVSHIGDMGGHLNMSETGIKTSVMNSILQMLYASLLFASSQAIVFEEVLKKRLSRVGNPEKIIVIPFGTERFPGEVAANEARKKLNLPEDTYIVFVFGFIAWYKGTDWLLNVWKDLPKNSNVMLILGGGGNPNHMNKPFYVSYLEQIKAHATKLGVTVTGFVPESDLPLYFQASDLILLPYRTMMSSSGPLSLAFSFGKPFLVSKDLYPLFQTNDLHEAIADLGLKATDLSFPLDHTFIPQLLALQKNPALQKRITLLAQDIALKRNWQQIGEKYYEVFFEE